MGEGMDHSMGSTGENARTPRGRDALRPHLASLRRSANDAPDLTRSILSEVGRHRTWLDSRERRMINLGRLAAVAAAITLVAGVFFVQRETEIEEIASGPAPRPIGELVRSVSNEAQRVDVRAALDGGAALTRVVFAQPLALVVSASETSHGSASVWAVQWLALPVTLGPQASTSAPEMAMAGFAGMPTNGQDVLPRAFMASPTIDTSSWPSTIVVPAAFESDTFASSRSPLAGPQRGP